MLTLIIFTVLATIAFRRVAKSKGYAAKRIQLYPVAIMAAVLVPSYSAEFFLAWAVSRNYCSEISSGVFSMIINVLCFVLYFGALSRAYVSLKRLPSLLPTTPQAITPPSPPVSPK